MMRQSMKSDAIPMNYSILFVCPENVHAVQIHEKHWLAYNLTMKLDPSGFSTIFYNEHSFSALQSVMIRLSRDQCSHRDLTSSIAKLVTVFNEVYHRNSEVVTLCSLAE